LENIVQKVSELGLFFSTIFYYSTSLSSIFLETLLRWVC